MTPDGREWQFVRANENLGVATAVVPITAGDTDTWASSTDNQGRIVYMTDAGATLTVGAYEDGIGVINDGTGAGQTFKIRTNNVTSLTLYPETALTTALSVSDSDAIYLSMSQVELSAVTSKLQMCQGGVQVAFTSGDYGWALTNGDGRAKTGTVLVVGAGFTTGDDTEGYVQVSIITEGPLTAQNLGYAIAVTATADAGSLVRWIVR